MQVAEQVGRMLFEETAQLTGMTEYGVSWNDLVAGEARVPLQGARFDIKFEGNVVGDRLNGSIAGVDYLTVRADGCFEMDIKATITTDDGAVISFHENGVVTPSEGPAELRLNMRFSTAHENYTWINQIQAWGRGTVDQDSGRVAVTAFIL
jgi:hypothetical protein